MYKKPFILCLVVLLFLSLYLNASADKDYSYMDNDSIYEIVKDEDEIIDGINDYFFNGKQITCLDEIDLSKAIKVYTNASMYEKEHINIDDLHDITSKSDYFYYLPFEKDEETTFLIVSKGSEVSENARKLLTEKEISHLESIVGKWHISGSDTYPYIFDYVLLLNNLSMCDKINADEVFIFGGISLDSALTAVIKTNSNDILFLDLSKYSDKPINDITFGDNWVDENDITTYEEMKRIQTEFHGNGISGLNLHSKNNNTVLFTVLTSALIIAISSVIILLKFCKRGEKNEK